MELEKDDEGELCPRDVLARGEFFDVTAEQVAPEAPAILEIVTRPVYVAPGDEGYADEDRLHRVLGKYLERLGNLTSEAPISELFPEGEGFTITDLGQRTTASRMRDGTGIAVPVDPTLQYTVGVPMGGLYELLSLARDESVPGIWPAVLAAVDAGLAFGDAVAAWYADEAVAPGSARVPAIAASLLGDPDYHDLRGYAALTFTQAIAPTL